jgi:hypothetical protein
MKMNSLENVDINLQRLTSMQEKLYRGFEKVIKEKYENESILLLYRGTEYSRIEERLTNSNLKKENIFDKAFYFGEKAHFCSDNNKKKIFEDINDCSLITIGKMFDEIKDLLSETRLKKGIEDNLSNGFQDYFSDAKNKENFISILSDSDSYYKLLLRDYYLYLLHTGYTIKDDTPLVSTSIKRSKAKKFGNKNDQIIFYYFVSQPFECSIITPWKISEVVDLVTQKNLPTYKPQGLYSEQEEISVKGGLFPQFILGIELVKERKFIVNPHLFQYESLQFEDLIQYGIGFDQSDFAEMIKKTKMSHSINMDIDGCVSSMEHKVYK